MSRLPTQDNCDQEDPKEAFQWALVALPFAGATPLIVQENVRPEWSELLWDLGFRHHPELQTKKIRPPFRGQQHSLNPSVQVVDIDDPEPDPVMIPDPAEYTIHEQQVMVERLRYTGALQDAPAPVETAAVVGEMFDPSEHSPSTVNGYLMGVADAEKRRVVALEMTGRARDQILRKWRGV